MRDNRPDITITFTLVVSNFHHWRHQTTLTTSLQYHRQGHERRQTLATPMNWQFTNNAPNNAPSNHRTKITQLNSLYSQTVSRILTKILTNSWTDWIIIVSNYTLNALPMIYSKAYRYSKYDTIRYDRRVYCGLENLQLYLISRQTIYWCTK